MVTAVFDTLKASRTLKAAGVADAQAEAIVTKMAGAFDDAVATKADIAGVKVDISEVKADIAGVKVDISEVKADTAGVRTELKSMATKTEIAELKADMLKVAMGVAVAVILANATMTIALIRFLP